MTEVIKKQNIIDMPDNSDMIAEAMKYAFYHQDRLSMLLIILKQNISCPNILRKSSIRGMEPTGIASSAKTLAPTSAMRPKTISSSTKDSSPSYSTKSDDYPNTIIITTFIPYHPSISYHIHQSIYQPFLVLSCDVLSEDQVIFHDIDTNKMVKESLDDIIVDYFFDFKDLRDDRFHICILLPLQALRNHLNRFFYSLVPLNIRLCSL